MDATPAVHVEAEAETPAGMFASSSWTARAVFFNAHQFQAKVANLAQDAVKVGLVADLADQDGLFVAWF